VREPSAGIPPVAEESGTGCLVYEPEVVKKRFRMSLELVAMRRLLVGRPMDLANQPALRVEDG
jgi:hypothetical protein